MNCRTTKSGCYPNLSYIARKPEPLGTEFKVVCDGLSGHITYLETQEGKHRMSKKEYFKELGATASCVARASVVCGDIEGVKIDEDVSPDDEFDCAVEDESENVQGGKELWIGDSWFGSVKTVSHLAKNNKYSIMHIKTAHKRCPKDFLETQMKDMPGGCWIVLEGRDEKENLNLVTVGYKYNKKKVLIFVFNKGAGSTDAGEPYEARFPDKFGNVCIRQVARPVVVSRYFKYNNKVDLHNQARQYDLALEKKWITQDGWFRLYTTIVGMTVVDCWKLFRSVNKKKQTILEFADELGKDMMDKAQMFENEEKGNVTRSGTRFYPSEYDNLPVRCLTVSTETDVSSISMKAHSQGLHTREYLKKGQLRCIWCSRVNLVEKKTTMKCMECGKGFCRDGSGNDCWSFHVALGRVPQCPKRGTKKRKASEA